MKILRPVTAILILIPFLISVSGVLVFHSQCSCTGTEQFSFYMPPETCSTLIEAHEHLFSSHADDLQTCCQYDSSHKEEGQGGTSHDCGCETPEAQFFKLINPFAVEKVTLIAALLLLDRPGQIIISGHTGYGMPTNLNTTWYVDPPPLLAGLSDYIYYLCNPKIPDIA